MTPNAHYVQAYDNGEVLAWPCYVDQAECRIVEFGQQDTGTPFSQLPDWTMLLDERVEFPGGLRIECMKDAEYNDYYMNGQEAGDAAIYAQYGDAMLILFDDGEIPV